MSKENRFRLRKRNRVKSGPRAAVVWDTKDLEVVRVYVGFSAKEALRIFLDELKGYYPTEDDDSYTELSKALDRYKIEELTGANVIIRRRYEEQISRQMVKEGL